MTFGEALEGLKQGRRAQRAGWNGKGMWIALTPGSALDPRATGLRGAASTLFVTEEPETIILSPHIDMRAADGVLVIGWLASQTDMLSDDWTVLP